jgi:hypothetical protein
VKRFGQRSATWAALVAAGLAACDGDVNLVGGGASGGAPQAGGAPPVGGNQQQGGEGGEGGADPICPTEGDCVAEQNCLLDVHDQSRCREIACDLPAPCDLVTFTGSGVWGTDPPYSLDNPGALACVLAALRDGTVGSYGWSASNPDVMNGYEQSAEVHVQSGRVGLGTTRSEHDLGVVGGTLGPVLLREPGYFEGCAALSSGDAQWTCLSEWSLGCP